MKLLFYEVIKCLMCNQNVMKVFSEKWIHTSAYLIEEYIDCKQSNFILFPCGKSRTVFDVFLTFFKI